MKYILSRKLFESEVWAPLLDLEDNVDHELIKKITSLIPDGGYILEISAGNGADAIELFNQGYDVTATENNIKYLNNLVKYIDDNDIPYHLRAFKHDTRERFPFKLGQFELVYSRLGLHYFSKEELVNIFNEIHRITNKYLVFTVKIEQDNIKSGKVILSKDDWEKLVSDKFDIISIEEKEGELYGQKSKWLEVVAERKESTSILNEIEDILIDVRDQNVETSQLNFTMDSKDCISIQIGDYGESDGFSFSNVTESMKRLVDYLADEKYYMQTISFITTDNYTVSKTEIKTQSKSGFDNRHPEKVIEDIEKDRLSKYFNDKGFNHPIGDGWIKNKEVIEIKLFFEKD